MSLRSGGQSRRRSLRRSRRCASIRSMSLAMLNLTILQRPIADTEAKRDKLLPKVEEDAVFRWTELVRTTTVLEDDERAELIGRTEAWAGRAAARASYQSKKKCAGWLAGLRKAKPGVLHRQVKPREQQHLEIFLSGNAIANPTAIMG
eukprot:5964910-Pyramimonas_sp.AAC.1